MSRSIGILTAGGDSPGLNAALRGVGKAAESSFGMHVVGFRDGFRGLMENRTVRLEGDILSGILTLGGTILGTSRDKPHRMPVGDRVLDMTDVMLEVYSKHHLDALVCLGGGGTQKNALKLAEKGLNIVTLPKTIDNDVARTDSSFGFDTAMGIATEAIDRLHSTAHSHHRIIVVEVMGNKVGWLALGAGIAGGADVILLPEIPCRIEIVANAIRRRRRSGKNFSIVAVAEGALSDDDFKAIQAAKQSLRAADSKEAKKSAETELEAARRQARGFTHRLTAELEEQTGLESRVTILGHLQRGGTPSAYDRILATRLGTACSELIYEGVYGVMVAAAGESAVPVPLEEVAGIRKTVPLDHPWLESARRVGTCFGDP